MVLEAAVPTMNPANRAAAVIPPWLRSTIVALVAGLDGDGLDGALARTFAVSCQSSMSNSGAELSQDARALVGDAIKHLSSTAEGGRIPLSTCASAIRALSQALEDIASPSIPTLPSGYPSIIQTGIPLEVLHHIFQTALASIDDYREHQQFMLSMALVSRSFHAAIAPTLRQTVHITSAAQLSGLRKALASDERRVSQINTVYLDLDIKELEWREGKPWHGRQLEAVLDLLAPSVRRAFVRLRESDTPLYWRSELGLAIGTVTGAIGPRVTQLVIGYAFTNANELHLQRFNDKPSPSRIDGAHVLMPTPNLTRLFLDTEGAPIPELVRSTDFPWADEARHPWTVLAVPFLAFLPKDIPRLLPLGTSTLRRLEATVLLPASADTAIADLTSLFLYIAPTLAHLTLRLDGREPGLDFLSVLESLANILKPCEKLESLEVGACAPFIHEMDFAPCLADLPARRLTLLPFYTADLPGGYFQLSMCQLVEEREAYFKLQHLTVIIEVEGGHNAELTSSRDIALLMDTLGAIGLGLAARRRVEGMNEYRDLEGEDV